MKESNIYNQWYGCGHMKHWVWQGVPFPRRQPWILTFRLGFLESGLTPHPNNTKKSLTKEEG